MKMLQSACMLAVACGVMTAVEAVAQTRDRPAAPQVRKTATQAKSTAHPQRKHLNGKPGQHARNGRKKTRPVAATRPAPRKAVAAARVPPAVAWVPPPLGPERFYPNGIPELRPEFMHPEGPPVRAEQAASTRPESIGGEPTEWLP